MSRSVLSFGPVAEIKNGTKCAVARSFGWLAVRYFSFAYNTINKKMVHVPGAVHKARNKMLGRLPFVWVCSSNTGTVQYSTAQ